MTIDEHTRHQLYLQLEAALGTEEATTLMEHLPPVGWADVATKHDLDALEQRIDLRFAGFEERMDLRFERTEMSLRAEFQRDLRITMMAIVGSVAALLTAQTTLLTLLLR